MAHEVAAVQRIQPSFYSLDKPRLVVEIVPDHGLRQFFGTTPGTPGELLQLFLLFRTKVHDHISQSRKACSTLLIPKAGLRLPNLRAF